MSTVLKITPIYLSYSAGYSLNAGTSIEFKKGDILDHTFSLGNSIILQKSQKQPPHLYDQNKLFGGTISSRQERWTFW